MRSLRPDMVIGRLLLSAAVLLGMSGTLLSAIACMTGKCNTECGMHAPKSADLESCCSKAKDQAKSSEKDGSAKSCSCGITDTPDFVKAEGAQLPVHEAPVLALLTPLCFDSIPRLVEAQQITSSGDLSPPIVDRRPDLGRAPPVA